MQLKHSIFSLIFTILFLGGCQKDQFNTTSDIGINDKVNQEVWYLGDSLIINLEINSAQPLKKGQLILRSEGVQSWGIDSLLTFDGGKGGSYSIQYRARIPDSLAVSTFDFTLHVEDLKGITAEHKQVYKFKPKEYEGLKLFVSFEENSRIEAREPHSSVVDTLEGSSSGGKFGRNLAHYISNMVVYTPTDFQTIYTGLDWHINHFHTGPVMITGSTPFPEGSNFLWRGYFGAAFSRHDGSILATTAEGVMEGDQPDIFSGVAKPHDGLVVPMGVSYFALTDISGNDPKANRDIIKIIRASDSHEIFREEGFKGIKAATANRLMRDEYAIFSTDKGLLYLSVKSDKVTKKILSYPVEFAGEAVDYLFSKQGYQQPNLFYAVKKDKGIFIVHPEKETDSFELLFSDSQIAQVSSNYNYSKWTVLSSENELKLYDIKTKEVIAKRKLSLPGKVTPIMLTTDRFVYITFPGSKEILRFDLENLDIHKSIIVQDGIADIGISGNLEGHPIDNH